MKLLHINSIENSIYELKKIADKIKLKEVYVEIKNALNKILAENIYANENIPSFERSTVDGYAVIAKDLYGASETIPTLLKVKSEIKMGSSDYLSIKSGETIYIPTGGMVPQNADAVVMIEYTEKLNGDEIIVNDTIAPGKNIMKIGADMEEGTLVLHKNKKLKPQDIGILAALGIKTVKVLEKPKATVISTGDEIISIDEEKTFGKIRDINGYCISALLEEIDVSVVNYFIIKDDYNLILEKLIFAKQTSEIIIISGGSSVGNKDMTERIINDLENVKPIIHGLAIKPGKPSIISASDENIFFGLPGHPASANIVFMAIVKPFVEFLYKQKSKFEPYIVAEITENIHASEGKTLYQVVKLEKNKEKYFATPVYNKSGAISALSIADGYFIIPSNSEGTNRKDTVKVFLW